MRGATMDVLDLGLPRSLSWAVGLPRRGALPRVTVTVAERVQVHVVVDTVRGEGVDDVPGTLVFPAAPVSVLEFT